MFQACLLAIAVCMDTFFGAVSCSVNGIKIPKRCALLISTVGTIFLAISLSCAELLNQVLPEIIFKYTGFVILLVLGSTQLMKKILMLLFQKHRPHWNLKALGLVIDICFDETLADTDGSKTLSIQEAIAYSTALSIDSLASGLGAGIEKLHIPVCLVLSFILGFLSTIIGGKLGLCCQKKINFSWLGGIMLLILAFCRLSF
ncbi:MAG: hypothetical protein HDT22_04140 [Ruminococcus sp.]|nr:hypothetical protein [Ruminococcus sp.]